jgi:two-component system, LytTR family, sensor kinase
MNKKTFKVSPWIIWCSSVFLGILASLPKMAERPFNAMEALVNSGITFLFSIFVWYYNIYTLPTYSLLSAAIDLLHGIRAGNADGGSARHTH